MRGTRDLLAKATGFMTNDGYIAEPVGRRCFCGHDHIQLLVAEQKLAKSILYDWWRRYCALLRQSMRAAGCGEAQGLMGRDRQLTIAPVEAGPTPEEPELLSILDSTDGAQDFRDRSTGLPPKP